jgi:putative phosphoesterase
MVGEGGFGSSARTAAAKRLFFEREMEIHVLLGVVSDTHGHVANARAAVRMLESLGVEAVLHCGDIGSEAIVPLFAAWPTHFVLGNVDGGSLATGLAAAIEKAGLTCDGRFGSLELAGTNIALLHGDDGRLLEQTIAAGEHQLVCHGHTHVRRLERVGSTLVLNPGALYRAAQHTIATVELPSLRAQIITV